MNTEASSTGKHPFARSGLGSLSDLESAECRELFAQLERDQAEFLAKGSEFRSPEYKWPLDPLHTWSRVWEYPYAYHHVRRWRSTLPSNTKPRVVDLGSGVTFFPFTVARLGCQVICTDTDPVAATDIQRAVGHLSQAPGSVEFRLCGNTLPFEDGEVDALFCVSVLEHIPGPEKTIREIRRILKPGGLLVLTIDLDLRGDSEIGPAPYQALVRELETHFAFLLPDRTVHPADMLTSARGPYPVPGRSGWRWGIREAIRRMLGKQPRRRVPFELAVMGFVLVSRE